MGEPTPLSHQQWEALILERKKREKKKMNKKKLIKNDQTKRATGVERETKAQEDRDKLTKEDQQSEINTKCDKTKCK